MQQNLMGVVYTLLLILCCLGLAFLVSHKNAEIARKVVHIGVAHWYFIYINCFSAAWPALAGLAAFAVINGILNVSGGLSLLMGQKSTKRNWGLVWFPISFFVMIVLCELGIGNRTALGCAMLGLGWGDGLAALIGGRYGKHLIADKKTWLGFLTLFVVVAVICFLFTDNITISAFTALIAAILEVLTPFGLDNISVPLGIYASASILSMRFETLSSILPGKLPGSMVLLLLIIAFGTLAILSVHLKLLTVTGALAAFLVGITITCSFRFQGLLLLLAFFISSNLLGKLRGRLRTAVPGIIEQKGAQRDHIQVAANGLAAALAAVFWLWSGDTAALAVFCAALAEATSDTWAGEIGRLSKRPPISMKSGKTVEQGISGGVTPIGFIGGFAGAAFIALLSRLLFFPERSMHLFLIVCLSGFAGCVLDSVLGAFGQALYFDQQSGHYSESPYSGDGSEIPLQNGYRWMDNDMVNFICNVISAILAGALWIVLT